MTQLKNQLLEDILGQLEAGKLDEGYNFVFNVKKNAAAELFIAMLRKALNGSRYTMRVRASQSDRKGKREQGFTKVTDRDVPLAHADRYRIYIDGIRTEAYAATDEANKLSNFYQSKFEQERRSYINLRMLHNNESESLRNQIRDLNKQVADLKKVNSGEQMQSFSILCPNDIMKEVLQRLALDRGYRWNGKSNLLLDNRVAKDAQKYLIISTNTEGEVRMFHGADPEDDSDICTSMEEFVNRLNANLKFLVTKEEKILVSNGEILKAVKSIKDRTGLWLKESKAIVDSYRSF